MYQRKPDADSVWQFFLWAEGEGRIRRSTKTRDLWEATQVGNSPLEIVCRYAFIVQTSDVVIKTIDFDAPEDVSD